MAKLYGNFYEMAEVFKNREEIPMEIYEVLEISMKHKSFHGMRRDLKNKGFSPGSAKI